MIVYNVLHRFFTLKADAESFRKSEGLPTDSLYKLSVSDRDELAGLLNAICSGKDSPVKPAPEAVYRADEPIPDFIPSFMRRDWERRRAYGKE